ncbi:hypothetical protein BG004_004471 [Podila humilis]|nr:hypothetical protein BG004_004471 [Podila humilis]
MFKSIVLLVLLASTALAQITYHMDVYNAKNKKITFYAWKGDRTCLCLKNTQTTKIGNVDVGDAKIFSSKDCTGNYVTIAKGKVRANTQWVNSMSFGAAGVPSRLADKRCPKYTGAE